GGSRAARPGGQAPQGVHEGNRGAEVGRVADNPRLLEAALIPDAGDADDALVADGDMKVRRREILPSTARSEVGDRMDRRELPSCVVAIEAVDDLVEHRHAAPAELAARGNRGFAPAPVDAG